MTRLLASHSSHAQWLTIRYARWLVQLYSFLGMEDARSSSILIFGFSFVFTRRDFSDMNYLGIIGSSRSRRARPYFSTWPPGLGNLCQVLHSGPPLEYKFTNSPGRRRCPFSSAGWLNFSIIFGLSDTGWHIFLQFLQY